MKNLKKSLLTILMLLFVFGKTSYATEDTTKFYIQDTTNNSIYDVALLEENSMCFEDNTGIRPYILIIPELDEYSNIHDYTKEFYSENFDNIFFGAPYFIITISNSEEKLDIFVSDEAKSIITSDILDTIILKYGSNIDKTEFHDDIIYGIFTDTERMIFNQEIELDSTKNISTNESKNTIISLFKTIIPLFIIALIAVILTEFLIHLILRKVNN